MNVPPPPFSVADWREFLQSYSSDFLESEFLREMNQERRADHFVGEVQSGGPWLGCEPAAEETVGAIEEELGVRLPQSYRNFLLVSNGWRTISYSVDLLKVDEIGWFAELDPGLLAAWDMEHFVDELEVLKRCLLISGDDGGSGQRLLLHADGAADSGEWPAYEWWPGYGDDPIQYADFATLVTNLWEQEKTYRATRAATE